MIHQFIKLSVFCFFVIFSKTVNADSFFYLRSQVCEKNLEGYTKAELRSKALDEASFNAVKNYIVATDEYKNIDDYVFDSVSYQIADNLLKDVSLLTIKEDETEICIEMNAKINTDEFNLFMKQHNFKNIDKEKAKNIADTVKSIYPEVEIPQIYISNLEFYNNTQTSKYTSQISEYLYFNPNIIVVTQQDSADYVLIPRLIKSSVDIIDDNNSKYSMSLKLELYDKKNNIVASTKKNRYIIIDNNDDKQTIADKMLQKLLKEAIETLQKETIIFN